VLATSCFSFDIWGRVADPPTDDVLSCQRHNWVGYGRGWSRNAPNFSTAGIG